MPSAIVTAPTRTFAQSSSVFGSVSTIPLPLMTVPTALKTKSDAGSIRSSINCLTVTTGFEARPRARGAAGSAAAGAGFDEQAAGSDASEKKVMHRTSGAERPRIHVPIWETSGRGTSGTGEEKVCRVAVALEAAFFHPLVALLHVPLERERHRPRPGRDFGIVDGRGVDRIVSASTGVRRSVIFIASLKKSPPAPNQCRPLRFVVSITSVLPSQRPRGVASPQLDVREEGADGRPSTTRNGCPPDSLMIVDGNPDTAGSDRVRGLNA